MAEHEKVHVICENLCLEEGMTKEQIQDLVGTVASGSPKGIYETVEALQNANPDTGVYIVTGNGHAYSWTKNASSAVDLGVYQATQIEDNSVTIEKTNFVDRYNYADSVNGLNGKYNNHTLNHYFGEYVNADTYYASPLFNVNGNEDFIAFSKLKSRLYIYINFYDSSKKLIQTGNAYNLKVTSPANAKYMTYDVLLAKKDEVIILNSKYMNTEIDDIGSNTQFTYIKPKNKLKYNDLDFVKKYNLIDTNSFVDDKRPQETVNTSTMYDEITTSGASTTNPIFIGDTNKLSYYTETYMRVYFYDENYLLKSLQTISYPTSEDEKKGTIDLAQGIAYFRVHVTSTLKNKFTFVKGNEIPDRLIDFDEYYIKLKEVIDLQNKVVNLKNNLDELERIGTLNNLVGKKVLWTGDSISRGAGNDGVGYGGIIAEENSMISTNYSISGTTVTKREGFTNSILERISSMSSEADFVIFEGGWNDMYKVDVGEVTNGYNATLNEYEWAGALESLIKQAKMKWKAAKIGFVLAHGQASDHRPVQDSYWDKAIEVFNKWNLPYIDLRHNGLCAYNNEIRNEFFMIDSATGIGDGTHPNQLGYETFYVNQITSWLKSL